MDLVAINGKRASTMVPVIAVLVVLAMLATLALAASPGQAYASPQGNAIAKTAVKISYSKTVYKAKGTGTKAYMSACKKLAKNNYSAKNGKQMQCNVPVAAAVRLSGADPNFPTTNKEMYAYMRKSKNWKCLGNYNGKESSLQPGDVLIRIKGTTTYTQKGKKKYAATNHACVYVGRTAAAYHYKYSLKGTDADTGKPAAAQTFVSAHASKSDPRKATAACLQSAKEAYADSRMIVFRYTGKNKAVSKI